MALGLRTLRHLGFAFSFRAIWAYGIMPKAVGGGGGTRL